MSNEYEALGYVKQPQTISNAMAMARHIRSAQKRSMEIQKAAYALAHKYRVNGSDEDYIHVIASLSEEMADLAVKIEQMTHVILGGCITDVGVQARITEIQRVAECIHEKYSIVDELLDVDDAWIIKDAFPDGPARIHMEAGLALRAMDAASL